MIRTLSKNWWLLGLSGILEAMISVFYLVIYYTTPDIHGGNGVVVFLSEFAVAAGACTIAASVWRSAKGKSWLLVLNGLTLSAYGLMALFWSGPLSFGFFALLLVVTAMTLGILTLAIARILQRRIVDARFFGLAGAASVGFALSFLALANHWIQLERRLFHPAAFLWLCFYFGFSAICMLGLALRLHNLDTSEPIWWNAPTPLVNPKHTH